GGFLTGSDITMGESTLAALPTRDAILPILANLFAAAEQGISLSTLWDHLPARFGRAGLIDNFPVVASQAILAGLIPPGCVIEAEFDLTGTVHDRSGAQAAPLPLDPAAADDWRRRKATLENV